MTFPSGSTSASSRPASRRGFFALTLLAPASSRRVWTPAEAHATLARYVEEVVARVQNELPEEDRLAKQSQLANQIIGLLAASMVLRRDTGFSTAYIGSSNLSKSALVDDVEWNVRLSQVGSPDILEKFDATFDTYWESPEYESYEPARDAARFDRAVAPHQSESLEAPLLFLGVEPWPHQREMLEKLAVERERHHRFKNLVVAATGTGKTIVAALDYKRLRDQHGDLRVLLVAHRQEILKQSLGAFRQVLRSGDFGELYVGGEVPEQWRHVFGSVQSLSQMDFDRLPPDAFEVVIVDEFHRAGAPTYTRLLGHLQPKLLL